MGGFFIFYQIGENSGVIYYFVNDPTKFKLIRKAPSLIERLAVTEKGCGDDGDVKWHLTVTRSKWRGLT